MPLGQRHVERLDALIDEVDDVEALREAHEVLVVAEPAGTLAGLDVEDVGRAADGGDREIAPADPDGPFRRAGGDLELPRRRIERLLHQTGVDPNHLRVRIDLRSRPAENVARFCVEHAHSGRLDDVESGAMQGFDLVVG